MALPAQRPAPRIFDYPDTINTDNDLLECAKYLDMAEGPRLEEICDMIIDYHDKYSRTD